MSAHEERTAEPNKEEFNWGMDVNIKTEIVKVEPLETLIFCIMCRESFSSDIEYMNHENHLLGCRQNTNFNENQKIKSPPSNRINEILPENKVLDIKVERGIGVDSTDSASAYPETQIKGEIIAKDSRVTEKYKTEPKSPIPVTSKATKDKKRLPCELCTKTFSVAKSLRNHVAVIHNNERPFQCQVCMKSFGRKALLKVHENIHSGEKIFECKICLKTFSKNSVLKVHEEIHRKQFQCQHCPESFTRRMELVKHERLHGDLEPFQCDVCSKRFARKISLKEHLRIHSGEKPFHCKVCFKCFSRSSHRKRHERTHSGEKPYRCKVCLKSFARNAHLVEHVRTHTGEKPIKCKVCAKGFSQNAHRYKHERTHKEEELTGCYKASTHPPHSVAHKKSDIKVETGIGHDSTDSVSSYPETQIKGEIITEHSGVTVKNENKPKSPIPAISEDSLVNSVQKYQLNP